MLRKLIFFAIHQPLFVFIGSSLGQSTRTPVFEFRTGQEHGIRKRLLNERLFER